MKKLICIKTNFPAIHNYPLAKKSYLRYPHRHLFYVEMKWGINEDRELEFLAQKEKVEAYIDKQYRNKNILNMSCEKIAEDLKVVFNCCYVSVYEDNENGAEIFD